MSILDWLKSYNLASTWADVAGLIGFAITAGLAFSARRAANAAKLAADSAREKIRLFDTVVDTQSIIAGIEEIKRLHRTAEWQMLPEKYAAVRKQLIMLRDGGYTLTDNQLTVIQGAVTNLSEMEHSIDKHLAKQSVPQTPKLNLLLSEAGDALVAMLQEFKQRGGNT